MPNVLIAPLDWGLGHATRMIPVIRVLQTAGCRVIIASEGQQQNLLQQEFPEIPILALKGYRISYPANKRWFTFKILSQLPKILKSIRREHRWLEEKIQSEKIQMVISDNRYGMWSHKVPCIFITHQLWIRAPFPGIGRLLQLVNYARIRHFTQCWVPDYPGEPNLAGILSHPRVMPAIPVRYLGALSRLSRRETPPKTYRWLILISGPEPQRTILEKKLLALVPGLEGEILFVRGKPGNTELLPGPANCRIVNHLGAAELEDAFSCSEFVLSRSGYTTVMEILQLKKKSILIPTPGQSEQEYLAKHLMQQQWCYCFDQDAENYLQHLEKATKFEYKYPSFAPVSLKDILMDFLNQNQLTTVS